MFLVVGATGFIGSRLGSCLGSGTLGLSRRPGPERFDLLDPDWPALERACRGAKAGVICAGVAGFEACAKDPDGTARVNVSGVRGLVERLSALGVVPVYLSSDSVYDGSRGDFREEDERRPITTYGRQRKEVEDFLMSRSGRWIILRLGKVYGTERGDGSLFTAWAEALQRDESIRCAHDQRLAPVHIDDVGRAVRAVWDKGLSGVYNLCGAEALSRYELAARLAAALGLDAGLIARCSIKDIPASEPRHAWHAASTEKLRAATGLALTDLGEAFRRMAAGSGINPVR